MRKYFIGTALLLLAGTLTLSSGEVRISGELQGSILDPSLSPFVVEKDIYVPEGKQVEIPAGCVFLFSTFTGLIVHGQLKVLGSSERPVVFTSIFDSEYNSASTQLSNPFDWNGILVSPTSNGSYFNNFKLCFSVYGIKSQSKNVVIQNGIFKQNGQFHFTVYDNIQYVQEEIPFSYGVSEQKPSSDTVSSQKAAKKEVKKNVQVKENATSRQTRLFRFTSLGIGIAGIGAGAVFTVIAANKANELENWSISDDPNGAQEWEETSDQHKKSLIGAAVSYGLGILGMVGFGVSFAF